MAERLADLTTRGFDRMFRLAARSRRLRAALARVPPSLRSATSVRISGALQRLRPPTDAEPISSNLGISRSLKVRLPADVEVGYLFGTPDLHRNERGALHLCRWLCRHAECFIDIGSYRGLFTFVVAGAPWRPPRIIFCEPEPNLYQEILHNVSANAIPGVVGLPFAVGAVSGRATFYVNRTDRTSSSLTTDFALKHDVFPIEVSQVPFRDLVAREGVSRALVKVDIEGAESMFLDGVVGAQQAICHLVIEILGPAIRDGFVARARRELGMHAYYVDEMRLIHSEDGSFEYVDGQFNWLFAREDPIDLQAALKGSGFTVCVGKVSI